MFEQQRKKKANNAFIVMYDDYIQTENAELRPELSRLLGIIETPNDSEHQLLRPENGWNKIYAWQVLRNQKFIFDNKVYYLYEGEVLSVSGMYVIFLSRLSSRFIMPGAILKPGYHLSYADRGDTPAPKWNHMISVNGIADERGLYLPIFDLEVVKKLAFSQTEIIKEKALSFLKKEKGYVPVV